MACVAGLMGGLYKAGSLGSQNQCEPLQAMGVLRDPSPTFALVPK